MLVMGKVLTMWLLHTLLIRLWHHYLLRRAFLALKIKEDKYELTHHGCLRVRHTIVVVTTSHPL